VTEVEVDLKLTARRAAQPGFNDCSFPTIAGAARFRPAAVQIERAPPPAAQRRPPLLTSDPGPIRPPQHTLTSPWMNFRA